MTMTMGQRLVQAAANKMAPSGAYADHRPDLYIADHIRIAKDSSRTLIGWGDRSAPPSVRSVENFVMALANGQVRLDHASLRLHPESKAVEVVLAWNQVTQPMERAAKMARLGPTRYLEPGTKAIWEVRKTSEGQSYIARIADDNLDELLEEKRRQQRMAKVIPSFSGLRGNGALVLSKDDRVRFHWKGLTREGTLVRQQADNQWVVKSEAGQAVVPENAISDIVVKDPATIQDYSARVMDYYKDNGVLPDDYMRQYQDAAKPK